MKLALVALLVAGFGSALAAPGAFAQDQGPPDAGAGRRLAAVLERAARAQPEDPHLAIALAESAMFLADSLGDDDAYLRAVTTIGSAHFRLGEYDAAMESYRRVLADAEDMGRIDRAADAVNNIGVLFFMWGEYDQALDYYLRALEIRATSDDPGGVAEAYNNVAGVHHAAGDLDRSLEYYRRALALYEESGDLAAVASTLNNLGLLFRDRGEDEEALARFEQALAMEEEREDHAGMVWSLNGSGMVYEDRGELDEALARYRRALAICERIGDRMGESIARHNVGVIQSRQGDSVPAIRNLEAALEAARELGVRELQRDFLLSLSEAVEAVGDHARALALYKDYKAVSDELTDLERTRQIAAAQTMYEVGLKDREIEVLRRDKALERGRRNALLAGVAVSLVIAILLYQRYRFQKSAAAHIRSRNRALQAAHEELARAARDELAHVSRVATMGELTAAFAHELKQPLTAIQANARAGTIIMEKDGSDRQEALEAFADIREDAGRAGEIIQRLHDLMRKGELAREPMDLNAAVTDILRFTRPEAREMGVTTEVALAPDLPPVLGDRVHLQQVILNLVRNGAAAMAAGGVHGTLTVATRRADDGRIEIAVRDQGPPVEDAVLSEMFEPFFTTKPDQLGMGLAICRTIVEAHGSELQATRNDGQGLTVAFQLKAAAGSL